MSILKASSAREAFFAFRMSLPWLKVPVCSSCHLVFLLHAGLYLQLHGHFNGTDAVQVIYMRAKQLLDPLKQDHPMQASACHGLFNGTDTCSPGHLAEGRRALDSLKQRHHMLASTCNSMASLTALTQSRSSSRGRNGFLIPLSMFFARFSLKLTFKKY